MASRPGGTSVMLQSGHMLVLGAGSTSGGRGGKGGISGHRFIHSGSGCLGVTQSGASILRICSICSSIKSSWMVDFFHDDLLNTLG